MGWYKMHPRPRARLALATYNFAISNTDIQALAHIRDLPGNRRGKHETLSQASYEVHTKNIFFFPPSRTLPEAVVMSNFNAVSTSYIAACYFNEPSPFFHVQSATESRTTQWSSLVSSATIASVISPIIAISAATPTTAATAAAIATSVMAIITSRRRRLAISLILTLIASTTAIAPAIRLSTAIRRRWWRTVASPVAVALGVATTAIVSPVPTTITCVVRGWRRGRDAGPEAGSARRWGHPARRRSVVSPTAVVGPAVVIVSTVTPSTSASRRTAIIPTAATAALVAIAWPVVDLIATAPVPSASAATAERHASVASAGPASLVANVVNVVAVESRLGQLDPAEQHGLVGVSALGHLVVDTAIH